MRICGRLLAWLLAALAFCAVAMPAFAHAVPDMARSGRITVAMRQGQQAVPGGTLALYRVGAVAEENGSYRFVPDGDFAAYPGGLDEPQDAALAEALAQYAAEHAAKGNTVEIDGEGCAVFDGLALGLYLLVQQQPADGYEPAAPFLVAVPLYDGEAGEYLYTVDATPKVELSTAAQPSPTPPPAPPAGPQLPQTGQLNWPVPVLLALGAALFAAGWLLRYGRKPKDEG